MTELVSCVLGSYMVTLIVAKGSIFDRIRPAYKFFSCRLCLGFWISAGIATWSGENFFIIYGLSYFMATQERG